MTKPDLKNLSLEDLKDWLRKAGHKPYRADQIRLWLFKQQVADFEAMENIPADLREALAKDFRIQALEEVHRVVSTDGTTKWLFRTHDGHSVETVLIPKLERFSVCVSTQVGCAMGCSFCRTAKMGFTRNLEAGEILEQIIRANWLLAELGTTVTNIIFMGMGEPLHNLDNVHTACTVLHDQQAFALAWRRMTVSTSGIVPKILELAERGTPCHLAVSLNGTNNDMRSSIMPVNRRWSLEELLGAVDQYTRITGEGVTFEFVLIKDITCTDTAAKELLRITQQRNCKVNAIVLNDSEDLDLHSPAPEEVERFLKIVRDGHVQINLRSPRGRDILAACGQLATKHNKVA